MRQKVRSLKADLLIAAVVPLIILSIGAGVTHLVVAQIQQGARVSAKLDTVASFLIDACELGLLTEAPEMLKEPEIRNPFNRDLDEMEQMVSATLDFMRGTESREKPVMIDISALLESLVAISILAIAGGAIMLALTSSVHTTQTSVESTIAVGIAEQLIDVLADQGGGRLTSGKDLVGEETKQKIAIRCRAEDKRFAQRSGQAAQ